MTEPKDTPLSVEAAADTDDEDLVDGADDLESARDVADDDLAVVEFTAKDLKVDPDTDLPDMDLTGDGDDEEDDEDIAAAAVAVPAGPFTDL